MVRLVAHVSSNEWRAKSPLVGINHTQWLSSWLPNVTTAQLKSAFRDSRLWAQGITFDQACSQPVLLLAMQCTARAKARRAERQGKPAPQQPELFEEIAA